MKRMLDVGGKSVVAEERAFQPLAEPWCEYLLEDGTRVRLRVMMTGAYMTALRNAQGANLGSVDYQVVTYIVPADQEVQQ